MRQSSRGEYREEEGETGSLVGALGNATAGILLALCALALCPWVVFGPPAHVGHYVVYSDGPWPRGFALAVRQADGLLRRQGLTPPEGQRLYLCSSAWRFMLVSGARPEEYNGIFTVGSARIALVQSHMTGREYTIGDHSALAETIAHELAHAAVGRILGRHIGEVDMWKAEGISSRVEFGADETHGRSARGRYMAYEDEDPDYFRDRLLVTEITGLAPLRDSTVRRLFADRRTAADLRAQVLRRHLATAAALPEAAPPPRVFARWLFAADGWTGWLVRSALGRP
jgi:hypothetical protein